MTEITERLDRIEVLLKDLLNKISSMRPLIGVDPATIPRPKAPLPQVMKINGKIQKYGANEELITNY
ncbi:MAG: hypothetical protein LBR15_06330 [Methanobrevibacter sp.]|jgi:hypothetical protein|nr:hypothetical protein [Candidatus Methanovirga australis]